MRSYPFVESEIYNLWRYYHQDEEPVYCPPTNNDENDNSLIESNNDRVMENNETHMNNKPETKNLAYSILRQLGCTPEETEDGRIRLEFQGITFLMEAVDECLFVNLIWPWCHSFSIYDIDEFARVRKVVNEINMNSSCAVFYIPNPESDEVAVHIKKHFLLTPQIPNLEEYMKVMFRSFFVAQRDLVTEIEKYRLQECEK